MSHPANFSQGSKTKVFTLQDNTAYDAIDLNGSRLMVSDFRAVWVWFAPDNYDGTAYFEISPDGGLTWFGTGAFDPIDRAVLATSVASPTLLESYIVPMPSYSHFRVKLDGGTEGSLTVYARLIDYNTF